MGVIIEPATRVNTYTTDYQGDSQITTLTDGGWVVTWSSSGQDGSGSGVYQQRYDPDGTPLGETLVNTITLGYQFAPQISALIDGGWVVSWQTLDTSFNGIRGLEMQAFDSNGDPLGSETTVVAPTTENTIDQQVTALADGGWVVTWLLESTEDGASSIRQQSYHADGSLRGAEAQVNNQALSDDLNNGTATPQVTSLADGGWVVTWSSDGPDDNASSTVHQQAYGADGAPRGPETLGTTEYSDDLRITSLADGGWISTWTGSDTQNEGICQQRYDSDGIAIGDVAHVNTYINSFQRDASVAALPGGGWVVAWQSLFQSGAGHDIYQQAYNADGTPLGTEARVSIGLMPTSVHRDPVVTALVDGGWVVTWISNADDGDGDGIFQQAFNPDGSSNQGTSFRINTYTAGDQNSVHVTALADGGWVVNWQSQGQDGDGSGIYQRIVHIDNHPPATMEGIDDQPAIEDVLFTFEIPAGVFADFEGDAFTYAAALADGSALPGWLHFDPATHTFSGTPDNGDVGPLSIRVTVADANGQTSSYFTINVANTNDAPEVGNSIVSDLATEDSFFTSTFNTDAFTDVDLGDTLTYTATLGDDSDLPDWLDFDPATRTFSGTPLNGDVGTLTVKVTASDGSASATTTFEIEIENTNDAPVVANPIGQQTGQEDSLFTFTIDPGTFNDVDLGDTLTYTAQLEYQSLPDWLHFDQVTGTFSGVPDNNQLGAWQVVVTASDGELSVSNMFDLTVENTNDAPIFAGYFGDVVIEEDDPFTLTFNDSQFYDDDLGDALTYTATSGDGSDLPDWLDFDSVTRTFSGTPLNGDVGTLTVKVIVSDGALNASATFDIEVENTNDAPVIGHMIGSQSLYEDSPFTLAIPTDAFTDVDQNTILTYSASQTTGADLPAWLTFDSTSGTFTGTPGDDSGGMIHVLVAASDGQEEVTTSFTITVNNVNDAPTGLDKTVTTLEDTAYTFSAADFGYSDTEGNGFKEIIVSAPPGSGELKLGGVVVGAGDHVAMTDLATLTWLADKDTYGDGLAFFSFQVVDDGETAHGGVDTDATPNVISFDVDEVTDVYTGGKGVERFTGTTAHDVFNGKGGRDKLTGDLGSDTFVFGKKYGRDTITDFDATGADHDIVDLSRLKGFDNFRDVKAALEKHGHDVWLDAGKDVLVFEDVNIKHLGKGDFLF